MTLDWPNLLIAWGIQFTGVMSPGPGVALILGVSMAQGRRAAALTSLGIGGAAVILATLTVIGLGAVLSRMDTAMTVVRLIGAAYLAWLAWGAFRKALAPPRVVAMEAEPTSALRAMLSGFVMQLGNPKAIFFWLAIAAVGSLDTATLATLVVFVVGAFLISFGGHGAWALVLSSRPLRAAYQRARGGIEGALGCFFAFASFKLLTARL